MKVQGKRCHSSVEVHLGSSRGDVQAGGKPWKKPGAKSTAFFLDVWNRGNRKRKTWKWDVVRATRCRKDLHGSVLKENKCVRMIFCKATGEDVAVTKMWVLGKEGIKHCGAVSSITSPSWVQPGKPVYVKHSLRNPGVPWLLVSFNNLLGPCSKQNYLK